jgi:midasin (ATPase involved in ribosome maturation)
MNPGGDYGKKELSPALRNRFTEIWVPPVNERADIAQIVAQLVATRKPPAIHEPRPQLY